MADEPLSRDDSSVGGDALVVGRAGAQDAPAVGAASPGGPGVGSGKGAAGGATARRAPAPRRSASPFPNTQGAEEGDDESSPPASVECGPRSARRVPPTAAAGGGDAATVDPDVGGGDAAAIDPDADAPMTDESEDPDAIRDLEDAAQEVAAAAFDAARDVSTKAAEAAREATASLSTFAAGLSSWWGAPAAQEAPAAVQEEASEGAVEGVGDSEGPVEDVVSWRTGGAAARPKGEGSGETAAAALSSLLDGITEGFNDLMTGGSDGGAGGARAAETEPAGSESEEEDRGIERAAAAAHGPSRATSGALASRGSGPLSGLVGGLSSIGAGAWERLGELAREAGAAEGAKGAQSGGALGEQGSGGLLGSRLRLPALFAGGDAGEGASGGRAAAPGSSLDAVRLPASALALAGPGAPEAPPEMPSDEAVLESFACSLVRRFCAEGAAAGSSSAPSLLLATPGTLHITSERVLFCARRGFPRGGAGGPGEADGDGATPRSPMAPEAVSPGEASEARAGAAALFAHLARHFPAVPHVLRLPDAADAPLVELATAQVVAVRLDEHGEDGAVAPGPCIRVRAKDAASAKAAANGGANGAEGPELVFGEFSSDETRNEALALLENASFEG